MREIWLNQGYSTLGAPNPLILKKNLNGSTKFPWSNAWIRFAFKWFFPAIINGKNSETRPRQIKLTTKLLLTNRKVMKDVRTCLVCLCNSEVLFQEVTRCYRWSEILLDKNLCRNCNGEGKIYGCHALSEVLRYLKYKCSAVRFGYKWLFTIKFQFSCSTTQSLNI